MNSSNRPVGGGISDAIADEQVFRGWSYDSRTDVLLLSGDETRETVTLDVGDGVAILQDALTGASLGLEISGLREYLIQARNREQERKSGSAMAARSPERDGDSLAATRSMVAQVLIQTALEVTGLDLSALEACDRMAAPMAKRRGRA